ncbi:LuxE/PaaK family acyltransferase [Thermoflexibacter ruber]|uniref:Acyl-protein synthetase, LuxE n=1 Tax=Thermoflexibacter ruber TaxID=1003 RepID=A0A1I2AXM6_9BACT|nr:acyl transferase [Thermoflexibacter ruber]SFE48662.1 Acyl-protein synthetase, LuxE [Thermoflexibacter ruber]
MKLGTEINTTQFTKNFKNALFRITPSNFEQYALQAFYFQATYNSVYRAYLAALSIDKNQVKKLSEIPFLPIDFFKTHQVLSHHAPVETIFESSGITGMQNSKHYLLDGNFYQNVARTIFEANYGKLADYQFFALLPSYIERANSSLVYMVKSFIESSKKANEQGENFSGFYLKHTQEMIDCLRKLQEKKQKAILIGVTFALLDFAEHYSMDLSHVVIMETGGMKGRRKEMIREEVHQILKEAFNVKQIHSEYGMTELLSQAYAIKDGIFRCPPFMKVLLRDVNDPFEVGGHVKNGGINVIDLANIDSCAFIETKDLGTLIDHEHFKVLGRYDNADVRGCNLMIV